MKHLLSALTACAVLAAPALATDQTVDLRSEGGYEIAIIQTPSLATNAIDTAYVATAISPRLDMPELNTAAQADSAQTDLYYLMLVTQGLKGITSGIDTVQVAIDFSHDRVNWTQAKALANVLTTATTFVKFHSNQAGAMKAPAPYVRFRIKNTDDVDGVSVITAAWKKG